MRNRLERGRLNKAARGELFFRLPTGYAFSPTRQVVLEPDEQARGVVRLVFEKFAELGSIYGLFHWLIRHDIRLGMRAHSGPQRGDLVWQRPRLSMLYHVLHNPTYAGAYAYGRRVADPRLRKPHRPKAGCRAVPMAQWKVLRLDCLPSYISWEQYVENQRQLAANHFGPTTPGVARQGRALLGGLVVCGECRRRMQVSYRESEHPTYKCTWYLLEGRSRSCPPMAAGVLDPLVERQLLRALEPAALELSLRAGADVERERHRLLELAQQDVERARYEAHRAERQYQAVEPENRLVGRELERRWEEARAQHRRAGEASARRWQAEPPRLSDEERARILDFSADVPALWAAPTTTAADRKSILRTLIERVTVEVRDMTEYASVAIQWAGGFISRHELIRRVRRYDQMRDFPQLLDRLVELRSEGLSIPQIADQLNEEGFRTTKGTHFHEDVVRQLLSRRGLGDERKQPGVLGPHEWWLADLSRASGVRLAILRAWVKKGWFHSRKSPVQGLWIVWADEPEMDRMRRLAACSLEAPFAQYPAELTTPRDRS